MTFALGERDRAEAIAVLRLAPGGEKVAWQQSILDQALAARENQASPATQP